MALCTLQGLLGALKIGFDLGEGLFLTATTATTDMDASEYHQQV